LEKRQRIAEMKKSLGGTENIVHEPLRNVTNTDMRPPADLENFTKYVTMQIAKRKHPISTRDLL
jgi:hypothetical protein